MDGHLIVATLEKSLLIGFFAMIGAGLDIINKKIATHFTFFQQLTQLNHPQVQSIHPDGNALLEGLHPELMSEDVSPKRLAPLCPQKS